MALDPDVVSSVVNANFKTVAEVVAQNTNYLMTLQNRAAEDSLQDQRDSRLISRSIMGSLCKRIVESDIVESVANAKNATADLPGREVDLSSATSIAGTLQALAVSLAQVLTKISQSTPPVTGYQPGPVAPKA